MSVHFPSHRAELNPPADQAILAFYVAAGLSFCHPSDVRPRKLSKADRKGMKAARQQLFLAAWKIDRRHHVPKSWSFGQPIPKNWFRNPQKDPMD